jgi:ABC-2 type transport system ATP-binding protein
MIEVRKLSKFYDDLEALSEVSFSISSGEIIGLLGPNGAGKTTLMKILTGYLHPTSGNAVIKGMDVVENTQKVQELIGYLPENAPLYPELSVQAYLKLVADLRMVPRENRNQYISDAVRAVGLEDRLTRLIGTLSKGYRQRVGLAQAILHKPSLLILDEPTNGLDPTQIVEVRNLIKKLAKNSTVLISTHILSEVEATCDRALIIMQGKLKTDSLLSELSSTTDASFSVAASCDKGKVLSKLQGLSGVKKACALDYDSEKIHFKVYGNSKQDLCPALYGLARENDWPLYELKKEVQTLEMVFSQLASTGGNV